MKEHWRKLLVTATGVCAVFCIAELLWLRSAQLTGSKLETGLLFLPWLAAAVVNLALWHDVLARARPTPLRAIGRALFWVTSGGFAFAFAALYGALVFDLL